MDSTVIELVKWIVPMLIAGVFSFAGIKFGLKSLTDKVEDNKNVISEKIDKLDSKLEKISDQQIKTDKELTLVEHRVKQVEEQQNEIELSLKNLISEFEKVKYRFLLKSKRRIDSDKEDEDDEE